MDINNISVNISAQQAADIIKRNISADSLVHQEYHTLGNKSVIILVYEKYYFRNSSTAGLTVTLSGEGSTAFVTSIASAGGQGILNISWGANSHFSNQVIRILQPYV